MMYCKLDSLVQQWWLNHLYIVWMRDIKATFKHWLKPLFKVFYFFFVKGKTSFWRYIYQLAFVWKEGVFSWTLSLFPVLRLKWHLEWRFAALFSWRDGTRYLKVFIVEFLKLFKKCRFFYFGVQILHIRYSFPWQIQSNLV